MGCSDVVVLSRASIQPLMGAGLEALMAKVKWTVTMDEMGYVRVNHSQRGQICVAVLTADGKATDISFERDSDRKSNMIRQPALYALNRWLDGRQK